MPQKKGAKGKKAAKVKDLPTRSVKAKDAAKVKGGVLASPFPKVELADFKFNTTNLTNLSEGIIHKE